VSLEAVKKEILSEAKNEEKHIIKDAENKAKEIIKECEAKLALLEEDFNAKTAEIIDSLKKKELSSAMLDAKKIQLNKKKEIIDKLMAEANKKIEELPKKDVHLFFQNAFDKVHKEIKVDKVYCNEHMASIVKKENFKVVADNKLGSGFVFENKDGSIRIDYTFSNSLAEVLERNLKDISAILF
jgi:V/A-type H+-transporting ATPase subunit E